MGNIKTVKDLREALARLDQDAPLGVEVEWAADTAQSDSDDEVRIKEQDGRVFLSSYMSDCCTTLEIEG